ncbi:MAG: ABC transporter ATP-binding protein [Spirochaetia bacterium]|nr:ABC transporter ATP-binding protein [Spirochaetia bacterium]
MAVLEVRELTTVYKTSSGDALALDSLDLDLDKGEMLGLIGESGCGKTTAGYSILRSVKYPGVIQQGSVKLAGIDLATLSETELRRHLWKDIAMIPQCAMNALNPSYRIGAQIYEAIAIHEPTSRKEEVQSKVDKLLNSVGLNARWKNSFPHKLSGGMKQRVIIAMALACNPKVIIADESTTGLDVLVQAQIIALLKKIQREHDLGILLISHDLAMISQVCERIGIMYAGSLVELGTRDLIIRKACHPYTKALLSSQVSLHDIHTIVKPIEGTVPRLTDKIPGCKFYDRCKYSKERCRVGKPKLTEMEKGLWCACHYANDLGDSIND